MHSESFPEASRARVLADLRTIVGRDAACADAASRLVYDADGLTLTRHLPDLIVLASTTAQVAAVMRVAAAAHLPVIARGAGTGLSGGCVPLTGGVVLSVARMTAIRSIDPVNRVAVVEPGVVNATLSAAARPHGLYFAPGPSSQQSSTLGGNVAENAGGPHCLKYGATTNHVLGVEMVLWDGEIIRLGGVSESQEPIELLSAVVGSEGTMGVVTEITVRLLPLPEAVRTVLCSFASIDDAGRAVSAIIAAGLLPASLEMLDNPTLRAVESWLGLGLDCDAGGMLLLEVDGPAREIDAATAAIVDVCRAAGARDVRRAASESERLTLWKARKSAFGAYGRFSAGFYVMDPVVPRSAIPEALRRIAAAAAEHGLQVANVFHAGDGNLHPCVLFDPDASHVTERAIALAHAILEICVSLGGALSGEHGIGIEKREAMPMVFTPDDLSVMDAVRRAFDPHARLNPGKIFPQGHGPVVDVMRHHGTHAAAPPADGGAWI